MQIQERHWRDILAGCIENNPKEKRRIATECGVTSMRTLDRWARGSSSPQNIVVVRSLHRAMPGELQGEMLQTLRKEFPAAFEGMLEEESLGHDGEMEEVPLEFYSRVLRAYTTAPTGLRQWTITNLVLGQLVNQLDVYRLGLGAVFVQYVLPGEHFFLWENGEGTGVWQTRQAQLPCTLERESCIGAIVTAGRPRFIQAFSVEGSQPPEFFLHREQIGSMVVYPIRRVGAVAGGLLLVSARQDFFTPVRRKLVDEYAHLFGLGFADREFLLHVSELDESPRSKEAC